MILKQGKKGENKETKLKINNYFLLHIILIYLKYMNIKMYLNKIFIFKKYQYFIPYDSI